MILVYNKSSEFYMIHFLNQIQRDSDFLVLFSPQFSRNVICWFYTSTSTMEPNFLGGILQKGNLFT